MIEFRHVYKTFCEDIEALKNINFSIDKGEFVFLTGPSGAGKTTLFRLLSCYDQPSTGDIIFNGDSITEYNHTQVSHYRRKIGVVFQDFRLLEDRTVAENVAMPLKVLGVSALEVKNRVSDVLSKTSLIHKKDKYPSMLSGGEQQRTSIARAIVHDPGILIADEPTGNLDPELSQDIIKLLKSISAKGTTVFVATHDLSIVEASKERQVNIKDGQITKDLKINEVRS